MRTRYLLAGILVGILFSATVLGKAKGEFRAVPKWWIAPALCIKSYEGAWTSNTGNGYFGGFQMDLSFQRAYGNDIVRQLGLAHRWPKRTQMIVAYRGYKARGWSPWPNTRRMCGL
jgi:hypothetical protein